MVSDAVLKPAKQRSASRGLPTPWATRRVRSGSRVTALSTHDASSSGSKFPVRRTLVKIDATTRHWCVTDPTPHSTLPDICFATTLDGLRLQCAGGLTMEDHPVICTTEEEAVEEAKNSLLVARTARQIRLDRRVPDGEVVRVTMHSSDGAVLFQGDIG